MSKSIKKNSKIDSHLECCDATYEGLHKWYVKEFETLGWMILAHDKKLNEKIEVYKMSLRLLQQSLDKKLKEMKDVDKKNDLKLMKHNVELLIKHVNKDF